MADLIIREATIADHQQIYLLIAQLGHPVEKDDSARNLSFLIDSDSDILLVAETDGKIAGVVVFSLLVMLTYASPAGRISSLVVNETLRNHHIGTRLLKAIEQKALERGCELIEVTSNIKRAQAHHFYEKNGYDRTSYKFALQLKNKIAT